VPYGGLSDIGVGPGDTVIVAPATGRFGGGAVTTALAMGAAVVACGRNEATLMKMKEVFGHTGRIETVILTGDAEKDAQLMTAASGNGGKGADAYIDFSPAAAVESTHITAALTALKPFGRAVFMGGIWGQVKLEYNVIMMKSLRIQVCGSPSYLHSQNTC
jgi:D-arabinose 1-dehydrogenase-like Zn-dependent alcohol dehydrogenase